MQSGVMDRRYLGGRGGRGRERRGEGKGRREVGRKERVCREGERKREGERGRKRKKLIQRSFESPRTDGFTRMQRPGIEPLERNRGNKPPSSHQVGNPCSHQPEWKNFTRKWRKISPRAETALVLPNKTEQQAWKGTVSSSLIVSQNKAQEYFEEIQKDTACHKVKFTRSGIS